MTSYTLSQSVPDDVAQALSTFHPLVQTILYREGITTIEQARNFLSPQYDDLSDPSLFADMDIAVNRLVKAVMNQEHIGIYGDYDADGIPGACVVYNTLRACNVPDEKITVYIPHRHYEGYGVHQKAVEELKEKGVQLLITVDVGITEHTTLGWIQSQGIDVIVTDHHEIPSQIPQTLAVIHPARDPYPDAKLCGAAVAFQLVRGFLKQLQTTKDIPDYVRVPHVGWEKWLLDLVGLATLSDMVPLQGENRILAHYGMQVLGKTRNYGLRALALGQRLPLMSATEDDVVFTLTPRLNAASRMDHPIKAFELLQSNNSEDAQERAKALDKLNTKRKTTVARIMKTVHKRLEKRSLPEVLVIGSREWEQGVLGLIASKITETYNVCAFVWSEQSEGVIKGSCRSANGVHLVNLMRACPDDTWMHFGGHAGAGGFALDLQHILDLEQVLNTSLENNRDQLVVPVDETQPIDAIVTPSEANQSLYAAIRSCAPFGVGNTPPRIAVRCQIREMSQFGKEKNHFKAVLVDEKGGNIDAIKFFTKPEDITFIPKKLFNEDVDAVSVYVVGFLEQSLFMGRKQMRIRIEDIVENISHT